MSLPPKSSAPGSTTAAPDQPLARKPTRRRAPTRIAPVPAPAEAAPAPTVPAGEPLQIVMIAAEAMPFAKEGGVADVLGSLPAALAGMGHDVRLFLPRYGTIDPARWELVPTGYARTLYLGGVPQTVMMARAAAPIAGVTAYFLDHEYFFGRHHKIYLGHDQIDEQRRYLLFCRAVLEALPALGLSPDIIHSHDWQAAPCAAFLRTTHAPLLRRPALAAVPNTAPKAALGGNGTRPTEPPMTRLIYTIHNLQYQGRWDPSILEWAGLDRSRVFVSDGLEYWGDVNWMKAGIVYADAVTTVSRTYAREIQTLDYGQGLDELLTQRRGRLFGIPNGIDWDAWNPATDTALIATFAADDAPAAILAAKERDRAALRAELGLPEADGVPVVGMVTRLADQKGLDLIAAIADELRGLPLQLAVLGAGQERYEALFRDLAATSANVRAVIGFDAPLSRRIYAGADFFLMPSAFEPGGLGQLIALRYGTLPIVRATGGLADTVTDLDVDPAHGNGVTFGPYEPAALLDALRRGLAHYAKRARWPALVQRAMTYDSRWSASAAAYADLYRRVLRLPPTGGLV
ncbi:MAG TPA: glycogen/starch synthase [Ktedonobacterales bacterium]